MASIEFSGQPTLEDIEYIALKLREQDQREIYNATPADTPLGLARFVFDCLRDGGFGLLISFQGRPTFLLGWTEVHAGVLQAYAFGTDDFKHISTSVTKFVIRRLRPILLRSGVHRLQADSRFDHEEAHRWLERLGFRVESQMGGFGKDRSTYYRFVSRREWFDVPT